MSPEADVLTRPERTTVTDRIQTSGDVLIEDFEGLSNPAILEYLSNSREKYLKLLIRESNRTGIRKSGTKSLNEAETIYRSAIDEINSRDDLVYELDEEKYGITEDTSLFGAKMIFTSVERKYVEAARVASFVDTKAKEIKKKLIEKYQNSSRLKKIVIGVGAGAIISTGLGAIGAAGITGVALAGNRTIKGYMLNKHYREGPGADEVSNQFKSRISSLYDEKSDSSHLSDALFKEINAGLELDQKSNKDTLKKTVGTVAIGSAIGLGIHELFNIGDGGSHEPSLGRGPYHVIHSDVDPNATDVATPEPTLSPAAQAWEDGQAAKEAAQQLRTEAWEAGIASNQNHEALFAGAHENAQDSVTDAAQDATEMAPIEFEPFTDTIDKGDGFTHVIRDLAKAEGYDGLTSAQLYEIYENNEEAFGSYIDTGEAYVMANGDYGISHPGELTINADLRRHLVEDMREKLGLPPLEEVEIGDSVTIDASDSDVPDFHADENVHTDSDLENNIDDYNDTDGDIAGDSDSEIGNDVSDTGSGEIVFLDNANNVINSPGFLDNNPWLNARSLAGNYQSQLFEKAIEIYASENDVVAEVINLPYGDATVEINGIRWDPSVHPAVNEILKKLFLAG